MSSDNDDLLTIESSNLTANDAKKPITNLKRLFIPIKQFFKSLRELSIVAKIKTYWANLPPHKRKFFTRASGILAALGYIGFLKLFQVPIRPDHAFVAFLIIALFFGEALTFLKYWGPFILLWLSYDMLRGIAWLVMPYIYVEELYYGELALYGWATNGQIFPFMLQGVRTQLENTTIGNIIDFVGAFYYINHMTIPIILAWLLYWKVEDKTEFKRLVYSIILTSYAAFITFLLFPSAPPWYVWNNGNGLNFSQPQRDTKPSAAGLIHLDRILHFNFFSSFYETFNANPFAAFPSLHAAYSLISAFFAIRKWKKKGLIAILWPLGMWFFAMYLNHHYLIDLLWGAFYATVFFIASLKIFKPKAKTENKEKMGTQEEKEVEKEDNLEKEKSSNSKQKTIKKGIEANTKRKRVRFPRLFRGSSQNKEKKENNKE